MRVEADGVRLDVLRVEGRGGAPPLLLVHGFTGRGAGWRELLPLLGDHRAALAPDLLGHAGSDAPAALEPYAFGAQVRQLAAVLDALGVERADVLGYGLGGRLALGLALHAPRRVRRLVLESCTAGIEDPKERGARRAEDLALAARIEAQGVEAFVEEWLARPLFATQRCLGPERLARARAERLQHTPQGLANSLRGAGQGAMPPLGRRLGEVRCPALLVSGALDAKYGATMVRMAAAMPDARHVAVPDAGHAVHVERPGDMAAHVAAFVAAP